MAVKIIFPPDLLDSDVVAFLIRRVQEYFSDSAPIPFVSMDAQVGHDFAGSVARPVSELHPKDDDTLVSVTQANGSLPDLANDLSVRIKPYYIDRMGRIFSRKSSVTVDEYSHQEAHVFNRLGWREPGNGFYYYPYGYLFRDTSVGEIDSLGFRIPSDLSFLIDRPKNHKVVAVFGGSAAFSMYSSRSEMFSAVLEKRLMEILDRRQTGEQVTVLNFGMHGNIVINEIMSFILYCNKFKPDVVIAHDGWNDFAYGLISDTHLLEKWNLTYQYNLEVWSQLIHASFDRPVNQPSTPYEPCNLAFSVLRAYMSRKHQFREIVEGSGSKFIWGLQPTIYDKPNISKMEEERTILSAHGMGVFSKVYPKVKALYDFFTSSMRATPPKNFVDFPKIFAEFDSSKTHFADHVHTVPFGDTVIADIYKDMLLVLLFSEHSTSGG